MPFFNSPVDSTQLYYRDYVPVDTVSNPTTQKSPSPLVLVLLHGWPMSSRMYEHLLTPLCEDRGFRCIAPDKRGFGRSDWSGQHSGQAYSWKVLVADLVGILKHLEVGSFVFIGASMGSAESLHAYQESEFIRERCKGFIWIGTTMPYPLQTPSRPLSPSAELWDSILAGLRKNRAQLVADSLPGIFAVEAGNTLSPKVMEQFERIIDEGDGIAIEKAVSLFNQETEVELKLLAATGNEIPITILHGDADQSMPLEASVAFIQEIVPWVELKIYKNGGHGLYLTHADQVLEDICTFTQKLDRSLRYSGEMKFSG